MPVSRPDPGLGELKETATVILQSFEIRFMSAEERGRLGSKLADAYTLLREGSSSAGSAGRGPFFGLRDFYSLCKAVGRELEAGGQNRSRAVARAP
jgi:hypothetical protein